MISKKVPLLRVYLQYNHIITGDANFKARHPITPVYDTQLTPFTVINNTNQVLFNSEFIYYYIYEAKTNRVELQ